MIYFITGNNNKFSEAQTVLGTSIGQLKVDLDEIQELDSKRIIEKKLRQATRKRKGEFIVDDVSLSLECFDYKFPGPLIKWLEKIIGDEGIYDLAKKYNKFGAKIRVSLGYINEKNEVKFFSASLLGEIVKPRGSSGFGWDPIFKPNGMDKTYAELNSSEARRIKVRFKAFRKLKKFLKENGKI